MTTTLRGPRSPRTGSSVHGGIMPRWRRHQKPSLLGSGEATASWSFLSRGICERKLPNINVMLVAGNIGVLRAIIAMGAIRIDSVPGWNISSLCDDELVWAVARTPDDYEFIVM